MGRLTSTEKAKLILSGDMSIRSPGTTASFLALRHDLAACLGRMSLDGRVKAMQNLARYIVKHWSGDADALKAVSVMEHFGRTLAYRDVYRMVITTRPWGEFSKAFCKYFTVI